MIQFTCLFTAAVLALASLLALALDVITHCQCLLH